MNRRYGVHNFILNRRDLTRGALLLGSLLAVPALSGCGEKTATGPVDIRESDTCARCGMLISDLRFAAEIITADDVWKFDDIGELFIYLDEEGIDQSGVVGAYVMDYATGEWVEADDASYVVGSGVATPMGTGVIAFADSQAASDLVSAEGGEERGYEDLVARPPVMSMEDGMNGEGQETTPAEENSPH